MNNINPLEIIETNKAFQSIVNRMKKLNEDINSHLLEFSKLIQDETQRNAKKVIEIIIENTNNIFDDFEKSRKDIDKGANLIIQVQDKNRK